MDLVFLYPQGCNNQERLISFKLYSISGVIQHYAESLPKGRSQVLSVEGKTEIECSG